MRNLKTSDIFSACRLLSVIGVREEFREIAQKAEENKGKKARFDMGFDLIFGILDKATEQHSETEVYKFLADSFECEWESVRDMDPLDLFDNLEKVADWEKWGNFFKRAAGLMKPK
jgi:hypothetical protein